ncbi:MAG: hypothetical protein WBV94_09770 [Blastocatellia bacterium]
MSAIWNIKKNPIEQGATFERTIRIADTDITDWAITMCLKDDVTGDEVELDGDNGGIIMTDAPEGEFKVLLTDEQTALITWIAGKHEIFASLPDGTKRRLLTGTVKVEPKVC